MNRDRYDALEERIGYVFKDRDLLVRAMTHASYGDGRPGVLNNERLEFLGDRVLGLVIARRLFDRFETLDEGGLAPLFNALVRKETCARVALSIELGDVIRMSKSERQSGGREKPSILGDACEALIAALYLDAGLQAAEAFIDRFWASEIGGLSTKPKDPKSRLQEWALARYKTTPEYAVVERGGPDHKPRFDVEVRVADLPPASGHGGSRRAAERAAARALLAREGLDD
jgi:ribonuclease-3